MRVRCRMSARGGRSWSGERAAIPGLARWNCIQRRPGSTERGDRGEQLAPVAYRRHADVLQIIGCQLRQHCPIDFVFAEGDLVLLETLAAQPRRYVHRAPPFEEPQLPVDGR